MTPPLHDHLPDFLSYLQKRMDFIAQVATSAPSWCLVTGCDDLIDHFNEQDCLIKNIVRSHQGTSGPNFEPLFEKTYSNARGTSPDLDIPHGEIGAQAFYTILENIVRNTAKYGDSEQLERIKASDGKLRFLIQVDRNIGPRSRGKTKGAIRVADFCRVRIIDGLEIEDSFTTGNEDLVTKLNNFLKEPLTDPATGVVQPKNWGMKEIKICAAYLRMVKQDQIDSKFEEWDDGRNKEHPPIMKVSIEKLTQQDQYQGKEKPRETRHLTYTLYFLRPRNALVVMPPPASEDLSDAFQQAGVDFYSLDDFTAEVDQGGRPRHSFLVLPKPTSPAQWHWLAMNLNFLPPRIILLDSREQDIPEGRLQLKRSVAFMSTPRLTHPLALNDLLWKHWVGRWWGDFQIFVRWKSHHETVAEKGDTVDGDSLPKPSGVGWIVFDHKENADRSEVFRSAAYHQCLSSGLPIIEMLNKRSGFLVRGSESMTTEMLERQTRFRIKEFAGLSVAVVDERVWLEKDGIASEGVEHYDGVVAKSRFAVWEKRRVFLQDTNDVLRNFPAFVDALKPPDNDVFDFVIIHQGIIDAVKDKNPREFQNAWKRLRLKSRWMVIDSGRGQPEQARIDDLRWVEYSNLAECLIQSAGDKFRLAELLWTLRASSRSRAM